MRWYGEPPASGLKDPVRMHEKALNDYVHDYHDWDDGTVIPDETCIIDLIRGRASCESSKLMLGLLEAMVRGFEMEVDGDMAQLTLLRCKNATNSPMADARSRRASDG